MRRTLLTALVATAGLFAAKQIDDAGKFLKAMPRDERVEHALNRLTFGPRPGDAEQVGAIGLKKWIELQLHPERIPENPVLVEKLKMLDSLGLSGEDLVRNYPDPQMVRQMMSGQIPFPTDPDRRMMVRKLMARMEARQGQDAQPNPQAADEKTLAEVLTPAEIQALRTGQPRDRVAALLAMPREKQDDVLGALGAGARQALFVVAPPELRRRIEMSGGPAQLVARDLSEAKMLRAIYSNRQLAEVLDDFWFNHFNVYLEKGADRYLVTEYERDAIRPRVLGKFRNLLEATAKSPAMLFYLDNWESAGVQPAPGRGIGNRARRGLNENYGRELMELHTLGVNGGYTQKDVTEVARCFTGWTIKQPQRGGKFAFNPRLHDNGAKTVLGVKIPAGGGEKDGEMVLDILARHPSTAYFISRQLAMRFVADEPPASLVDRMTVRFLKSDGDIRAVLETMFRSKEFWSEGAYRSKMKSPFEMAVSAVRAAAGDVDFAFPLVNQVAQMGEPLYRKMEPTGYSNASREWMNTAGLMGRMNFALQLADNRLPGVKVEGAQGVALGSPEFQKR
jgi:uncharacterized protein (DUF1800 family)